MSVLVASCQVQIERLGKIIIFLKLGKLYIQGNTGIQELYTHTHTPILNEGESDLSINRVNNPPILYDFKSARISHYPEIIAPCTSWILIFHLKNFIILAQTSCLSSTEL